MQQEFDIRTMRDYEDYKKKLIHETNQKIHSAFLEKAYQACYSPCMKNVYYEDLTEAQMGCLAICADNFRMAEYIVTQCSNAKNAQLALEDSE